MTFLFSAFPAFFTLAGNAQDNAQDHRRAGHADTNPHQGRDFNIHTGLDIGVVDEDEHFIGNDVVFINDHMNRFFCDGIALQGFDFLDEVGAGQQILPEDLKVLLESLTVRRKDTDDKEYNENIEQLRARIDVIDENLLDALRSRMEVSRKIGQFKKSHNIAIVQASRWDSLLAGMIRRGAEYGLSESFVTAVFTAIHEASVDEQNKILGGQ